MIFTPALAQALGHIFKKCETRVLTLAYNPGTLEAEASGYQEFMVTTQQVSSRATERPHTKVRISLNLRVPNLGTVCSQVEETKDTALKTKWVKVRPSFLKADL